MGGVSRTENIYRAKDLATGYSGGMKIKGYTRTVPSTNPSKSLMFSSNGQTGGTTYAKGFTQNRRSPSIPFRSCDNFFVFLDSVYADFPDGPVTNPQSKAAWQQASDQSAGWSVCGCMESEPNGQTYHRCYNYFLYFNGQAITNTAPNPTAFYGYFIDRMVLDLTTNPAVPTLSIYHTFPAPASLDIIVNCNLCFLNYSTPLVGTNPDISFPTIDQATQIQAAARNGLIGFCTYARALYFPQQGDRTSLETV